MLVFSEKSEEVETKEVKGEKTNSSNVFKQSVDTIIIILSRAFMFDGFFSLFNFCVIKHIVIIIFR